MSTAAAESTSAAPSAPTAPATTQPARVRDYSLTGRDTAMAMQRGLAEATWYRTPVPKERMRELLARRDGPAIRDTLLWFVLLGVTAYGVTTLWGSPLVVLPVLLYAVLYGSSSDSRWHESLHGTAFKSDWMNNALYELASFMVMRNSTLWRWSHTRHHSDTMVVGRDTEVHVPRPANLFQVCVAFTGWTVVVPYFKTLIRLCSGNISDGEKTFVPASDFPRVIWVARVHSAIYLAVIASCIVTRSILPLMFVLIPNFLGSWLMIIYGLTQHAGLADDTLDHRMVCRTILMNRLNRYLYWNMNFHVEHHMFPLVPYHNLPLLHQLAKHDCPVPYASIPEAYREIIPTLKRQATDPEHFAQRVLPPTARPSDAPDVIEAVTPTGSSDADGWIAVAPAERLRTGEALRVDHDGQTFAIYRTDAGTLHATDGICTHGSTHLADGFVTGNQIECPKHNGRFDVTDGSPKRAPVCVALRTWPVENRQGTLFLNTAQAGGLGAKQITYRFQVVSNDNVATFIKELVLEPIDGTSLPPYQPGQYLQLDIPAYPELQFGSIDVKAPFAEVWRQQQIFAQHAANRVANRRNYSLASNPASDRQLRFNVRLATAPRGTKHPAGAGSSYVFNLKPGEIVTAIGPFGDFLIKQTHREMVYIGGGAGMAPLRSHLSHLFDTHATGRKVSFWYGARSMMEVFYREYFDELARKHPNFHFHLALSDPMPTDGWTGPTGFIHDVLLKQYLASHADPASVEYYLCGPPPMIQAATGMLASLGVPSSQISFDAF